MGRVMSASDPKPETGPEAAFRLKSAAGIRAGWLQRDLMFLVRSLRYLLRPRGEALRLGAGLEAGEIGILSVIGLNPGVSQNDLAASVVLKKSAVTRIVQNLERRGLIRRDRSQADRRANCLTLTRDGAALVDSVRAATQAMQDDWFADVPPAEREVFFAVLNRLVERLATDPQPDGGDGEDKDP